MELINPNVELIEEPDILKKIELAGRTCYKSEDKITEGSAERFVKMLCKHGHTAATEHGTVYLILNLMEELEDSEEEDLLYGIIRNRFSTYTYSNNTMYATTNFRVVFEACDGDLDKTTYIIQKYGVAPTEYHDKRYTFRITCDRGVSHELVRHRVFSFAQESTRYVNYKKKGMQFIRPAWCLNVDPTVEQPDSLIDQYRVFWDACEEAEKAYNKLIELGQIPQQARAVLPNALKTEVVMTGTYTQWQAFLKLRMAPDAHPDIQIIANKIAEILN